MASLMLIAIGSALCSNVVLSQFLESVLSLEFPRKQKLQPAWVVQLCLLSRSHLLLLRCYINLSWYRHIFEYLKTIVFILVIAALVQMVEMSSEKLVPSLYKALGVYLPLITTNCAVLGVALNNVKYEYSILESVVKGIASAWGI